MDSILFALTLYKAHRMHLESGTTRTRTSLVSVIVRDGEPSDVFNKVRYDSPVKIKDPCIFCELSHYTEGTIFSMMIESWLCSIWPILSLFM